MDELVELGRTAGAYGFRGWVRVIPHESGEVLQKVKTWVLTDLKGTKTVLRIEAFRRHGEGFIAKWEGCDTKEQADAARGRASVARADFPDAGDDISREARLLGYYELHFHPSVSSRLHRARFSTYNPKIIVTQIFQKFHRKRKFWSYCTNQVTGTTNF